MTALFGLGPVLAARILGRVGDINRFPSEAHFASYCGAAPIEASSGDTVRHRLSRAGDRTLNHALHMMAITQVRSHPEGRTNYQRKRAAGKSHNEAMRCLKRRLVSVIYRTTATDAERRTVDPGGQTGASLIQRGQLNPDSQLFGEVTTRAHQTSSYEASYNRRLTQRGATNGSSTGNVPPAEHEQQH